MSRDKTILPANAPDLLARIEALESSLAKVAASTAPGRSQVNSAIIGQTAHGFAVGNVIRHNGSTWVKSLADSPANAHAAGIVTYVPHPNAFVIALPGSLINGLSGLTAGLNYVSPTTAGLLTATAPTHVHPALFAITATSGLVLPDIPTISISTADPGSAAGADGDLWFKY